jgi:hypothetical protein
LRFEAARRRLDITIKNNPLIRHLKPLSLSRPRAIIY